MDKRQPSVLLEEGSKFQFVVSGSLFEIVGFFPNKKPTLVRVRHLHTFSFIDKIKQACVDKTMYDVNNGEKMFTEYPIEYIQKLLADQKINKVDL